MPASPIRKLVPFAEQAKRDGKKVYHLNIGQPDIATPTIALDAVRHTDLKVLEYSHSAGDEHYRRRLVDYYKRFDITLTHNDILVTTGGSEAIFFGLFSCLDPDDEIIIPEPLYANYNGFTQAGNIIVRPVTASIETGFALPSIADFERVITPRTRAIMICNPSNPTGYLYSREELYALRDICLKHDLYLFSDEVYREFRYTDTPYTSVLTIDGLEEHAVVIDSISKRYSACGARIGALVSHNKSLIATALKFAQARLSPPTLEQILANATLDVPLSYTIDVTTEYRRRRDVLVTRLQAMSGVCCPNPGGAFYVFAELPIDDSDRFCQWLLDSFDHEGQTVMLAPGTGFYATKGLGKREVRMAYVLNIDDLNRAMDCLEAALSIYPHRTA